MAERDTHMVPLDEALARLDVIEDYDPGDGPKPCVHTFVDAAFGLLGAHWSLEDLRELIEEHGVETSGEMATAMHHGLVVLRPSRGPLFLATKEMSADA